MRAFRDLTAALLLTAFAFSLPASAQGERPDPYKAIPVKIALAPPDAKLDALRKDLAEIAKRKDRTALAKHVAGKDFFWERDFGGAFDAKKSALDNLLAALNLDGTEGGNWDTLAGFATESTAGPLPGRPAAICTPAFPQYDEAALEKLIEDTQSDGLEWYHPRQAGIPVRAAAKADAAVVETAGLVMIRVLEFQPTQDDADPVRSSWAHVALPSGKTGFVAPGSLMSPVSDRLCFGKDSAGNWHIVGYVGGGD
jgi:hypothetical protein